MGGKRWPQLKTVKMVNIADESIGTYVGFWCENTRETPI